MPYKVGDWVKINWGKSVYLHDDHYRSVGKVTEVFDGGCEVGNFNKNVEGYTLYFTKSSLEPRPFQVGDRVRISNKEDEKYGKEFTILESGIGCGYDWSLTLDGEETDWFADNDELELLTPVEEIEKEDHKTATSQYITTKLTFTDQEPFPRFYWSGLDVVSDYKPKKEGIMSMLRDIPKQIKKLLSPNMRAMYKLGWINSELEMTDSGLEAMKEILLSEYEEELGKMAQKEVKRIEKEEE